MLNKLIDWIKDNKYSYLMISYPVYLLIFLILDFTIKPKYIIDCKYDALIPFNEFFFIPYASWFVAFVGAGIIFMFYDKYSFQQYIFVTFTGILICFAVYIIIPNGINLRVTVPDRNVFCWILNHMIWKVDAAVNVCPSMHVSSSLAIALVSVRAQMFKNKPWTKLGICIWMFLICASTLFVKQHSIVDVACGAALTVILYIIYYHTNWRKLFAGTRAEVLVK